MIVSDRYLLNLLRQVVSERAGGRCEFTGETDCNPHHIFPRANKSTRYDPNNCVWLSNSAHRWAEAHPEEFRAFMIGKRGIEWWRDLVIRKNMVVKFDNYFREQWKEILQKHSRKVV